MNEFKVWVAGCTREEKLAILERLEEMGVVWSGEFLPTQYIPDDDWNYLVNRGLGNRIRMRYGVRRDMFDGYINIPEVTVEEIMSTGHEFSEEDFMNMIGG